MSKIVYRLSLRSFFSTIVLTYTR